MDKSPLGKLPPERRNRTYELVFSHKYAILISQRGTSVYSYQMYKKHHLALTRTCKIVRAESIGVFYASNTFAFYTGGPNGPADLRCLDKFRHLIGSAMASSLRKVSIRIRAPPATSLQIHDSKRHELDNVVRKVRAGAKANKACAFWLVVTTQYRNGWWSLWGLMIAEWDMKLRLRDFEGSCQLLVQKLVNKISRSQQPLERNDFRTIKGVVQQWIELLKEHGKSTED